MVSQRHRVVLVVIDLGNVAVPADASAEKLGVEVTFGDAGVLRKHLVAAQAQILRPRR